MEKPAEIKVLLRKKSRYNDIYVLQNGSMREMWFKGDDGFFLQSRIDLDCPEKLILIYSRMMMLSLLFQPSPRRILMVGLGGGAVFNFLGNFFPRVRIDGVEIDEKVIECSRKYFFLRETDRCRVFQEDGRVFVQHQEGHKPYDLIILDAFKSGSVPFHLKTREFYREIRRIMNPDGAVVSNLYGRSNPRKPNDRNTFASEFRHIYCFEDPEQVATVSVVTNQEPAWSPQDFLQAGKNFDNGVSIGMEELASYFRPKKYFDLDAPFFKDDFAGEELKLAVEQNNRYRPPRIPYPIKSSS